MNWTIFKGMAALGTALLIAGCGAGGGGGAGGTQAYTISLKSDKSNLPLNIAGYGPSIGGTYTTTLYVSAKDATGNPVTGGTFNCNVVNSLDAGPLYYLDGKAEHETTETINGVEVTTPNAYRAITLDSNAGAATFHYHASDLAETATVRCGIVGKDGVQRTADVSIQVGSTPSGKVSQIIFVPFSPNYLFVQQLNNYTQVQGQVWMVDEAGQRIPNPAAGTNNLEVNIWNNLSSSVEDNAILRGVDATGKSVADKSIKVRSINGQAQFTLVSGSTTGTITVEAVSDRADNNVDNGITERVSNLISISVLDAAPGSGSGTATPVTVSTTSLPDATGNVPYGAILDGSGGTPPYTWALASGTSLPGGISLSSTGVLSGTPYGTVSGTYSFVVRATDSTGSTGQKGLSINYTAATQSPPTATTPSVTTGTISTACSVGASCVRTLSATGGSTPYTWSGFGLPAGLSLSSTGVLSGVPTQAGDQTFAVVVTSADGLSSPAKIITLPVTSSTGALNVMTTALPDATTGTTYSTQLVASGGTSPYTWTSSVLPSGLSLAAATGIISGTPTVSGNFTIRATVTDSTSGTHLSAFKDLSLTIATGSGSGAQALTVTPAGIASVPVGQPVQMMVYGGVPPYNITSTNVSVGTVTPATVVTNGGFFTFDAVSQGSSTLIITDFAGTVRTVAMSTVQPGGTVLAVAPGSVSWSGTCDGTVAYTDFVVYGGVPPYTAYSTAPSIATVPNTPTTNGDGYSYFRVSEACDATGAATIVIRDSVNAQITTTFTYTP